LYHREKKLHPLLVLQQEEDLNLEEVDLYANMLQNSETDHPQVQQ
jgi:hypothetical protein